MRVVPDTTTLETAPGGQVEITLDVVNTTPLIDGITARVIGVDPRQVSTRPALLPLFPDAAGRMAVSIGVPNGFPAGRHPLTVELSSSVDEAQRQHVDVDLVVEPRPQLAMTVRPNVQRGYRRGRFHVELRNRGNVPVVAALTAVDNERLLRCDLAQPVLSVDPGATASTMLSLRAKRRLFGSDLDRPVTLTAESADLGVSADAVATLRQRPVIARGMLTVAVLACILAAWAGAFLLGLTKVFAADPLTKAAPASFFVSGHRDNGLRASVTPTGVLPKDGTLPPGVGAGISGTVTAASTGAGAGRVVVEALRLSSHGMVLTASAATQSDGSYVLLGLLPGHYYVRFSALGFRTAWYPSASAQAGAHLVTADAQALTRKIDTNVVGLPASISGAVDPGDTLKRVHTVVTARALQGTSSTTPVAKVSTDKNGNYRLRRLPAPATYELSFTTPGYAATTVVERVAGGQARSEPTVRLSAGAGSISGLVTADGKALGGVTVVTNQAGQAYQTTTPTLGTVGRYAFTGLPTPGTYVLTFSRAGFGARTVVVDLSPGQQRQDLAVHLTSGTGTVTGHLRDSNGNGLGGATVTVGGAAAPVATVTLTDGDVGAYAVSDLGAPGSYTLTFALPGYAPQTVPVQLSDTDPRAQVDATLTPSAGGLTGRVLDPSGSPVAAATVSVTDGSTVHTTRTVTASAQAAAGSFRFTQLPTGTYAVTITADGFRQETALVTVTAPAASCQNFVLARPGDPIPEPPACG